MGLFHPKGPGSTPGAPYKEPEKGGNMEKSREPSYYAIIPAEVRYDKTLRPTAKLLYGEISALTGRNGYCWATNQYFADLYQVSEKTVTEWVTQLQKAGYIKTELIRNEKGMVTGRKIYLCCSARGLAFLPPDFSGDDPRKISEGPPDFSGGKNNTSNNINTPKVPSGDDPQFQAFWAAYPAKKAKQNAIRAWKKIGVTAELFGTIMQALEQAKRSPQWTRDGGRYIPHPATWLNGRRWEDELDKPDPEPQPPTVGGGVELW